MNEDRRHVVLLPYPSQGHINPLLQFAKRLASKGVKATLATTHYTAKSMCGPHVGVEPISDGFDEGGYAQAKNEDLFLKSFPVNCVVYDSFLPWALDVAKEYGLYGAAFFTNSATVCNIFCRMHHGWLTLPVKLEDTPLSIPGLPSLNFIDLPTFVKFPESYPAYLAMKLSQYSNLDKADWIFGNTFQELEGEVREARSISELWPGKLIGPMVPSAYLDGRIKGDSGYGSSLWKPLSEECSEWLETKPQQSVVYISFGSMVSLTAEQMEESALALKDSSLDFLWVVRESQQEKLPNWFMDSTKQKGLVVSWCNQLKVLEHPAVGCFVTHCGWNSTLEGMSLGVPMIGVPQWADQLTDAKYIEEVWGIGVRAKEDEKGIVRKEEILKCFKEVMEGERSQVIKKNASEWKKKSEKAMSEGGSSDQNICDFVNALMCSSNGKLKHSNDNCVQAWMPVAKRCLRQTPR
ncbi:UDP-glycosyltransferase 74B1 [Citrus sinensis]|uniref:UDP-glycosyltransferase 74B1 n=1 Tax=Citrus sinensis TaxID=2711 RepID=A0ACB8LIY7_CITSI|nr:UDP-glycosyltransferase 74B1 [Citrus sinensis]